jgi:hypothetical protein
MKNYRWDSPTKELGSREKHSFFSQEKNGCVNHPSPRTWWENKTNMTISTKKHGKSTIWLMFSHFGQLKLEFLDISWGNPMIITMSSSSHRRGWRETRRSCSEKNMWTEPSW